MTETGPCPDWEGEELEVHRQQRAQKPQPGEKLQKAERGEEQKISEEFRRSL